MLNKKNALVTGAAGILGPQHALALNELGFNIILIDIDLKNLKKKYEIIKKKLKKNTKVFYYKCDITKEDQVEKISDKLIKSKIFVDVLVNNADDNPKMTNYKNSFSGRIEDYSIKRLSKEISVGIIGTFICSKIFSKHMKKRKKGVIINISSDLGIVAPDQSVYDKSENIKKIKHFKPIAYSISKHAIIGITKYLSTYWASNNIRCNTLVPGAVLKNQPEFLLKNIIKRVPLKRLANETEYKKAIQFLATDSSSYMTGQSLIIDGGRTVW